MNLNPFTWTGDEWAAAGKQVTTATAAVVGTLVTLHFVSAPDAAAIGDNINHVVNGAAEFAKGIAGLVALAGGIASMLRSVRNASPESKKASVAQQGNTLVVTAEPGTSVIALANKISTLNEAGTVLTTPGIAAATPSDKIVAPTTTK